MHGRLEYYCSIVCTHTADRSTAQMTPGRIVLHYINVNPNDLKFNFARGTNNPGVPTFGFVGINVNNSLSTIWYAQSDNILQLLLVV